MTYIETGMVLGALTVAVIALRSAGARDRDERDAAEGCRRENRKPDFKRRRVG